MSSHTPDRPPCIIPYLVYQNAPEAIDFLGVAFGFSERSRYPMPDGRIGHAELAYDGAVLYLASAYPEMGLQSPLDLPAHHCQLYVWVDDVDAHCERARRAGATISAQPADQDHGGRLYRTVDPEGHRWIFASAESGAKAASHT